MYIRAVSIHKKIKILENERSKLMAELISARSMLRGSFGIHFRRCGTLTCWCVSGGKGHPQSRITWGEKAKKFSKTIPEKDVAWIKEVTDMYRNFRKIRQRLREINEQERFLLDELENDEVNKTRKLRNYL
jgi:hypothetical protein